MRVTLDLLDRYEKDEAELLVGEFEPPAPVSAGEFVCTACFLVRHHTQLRGTPEAPMCRDCAEEAGI